MKTLPTTSYIILGILSFGQPLSGYDIRKTAKELSHFYPAPAHSQIYRELRRLDEMELLTSEYIAQEGKPDKQEFEITPQGTAVLQQWMQQSDIDAPVRKHPLLLRLYFGHVSQPKELISMLERYIAQCNKDLAQLAIVEEYTENDPDHPYAALVVEWNAHYVMAERTIAQKMLDRLQRDQS